MDGFYLHFTTLLNFVERKAPPGALLRYNGRLTTPSACLTLYLLGLAIMVACPRPNSLF
jgi:hypothetical protein